MELKELARIHFGDRIFTATDLIEAADPADLPSSVQYSIQRGGSPTRGLGILMAKSEGLEKVGYKQHVALWRVQPQPVL